MMDPKKNPNKQRRSFFWRRKPLQMNEPAKPENGYEESQREAHPWYRPTLLKATVVGLGVLAILPPRANGQFGIDTVAILAALSKMQSLMNTYIATPLKTINQYEQSATESYTPVNSLSDRSALGPLNRFSQQHKFTMSGGLGLWNAG